MNRFFVVLLCSLFALTACGGGGGGGGGEALVVTPLSTVDDSTVTGTYDILLMAYDYTNQTWPTFTTDVLDQFSGQMTMDMAAGLVTYRIDWSDSVRGDFSDSGAFSLDDVTNTTWDSASYVILDAYTIRFSYVNLCDVQSICADVDLTIQKTSDSASPLASQLIAAPASSERNPDSGAMLDASDERVRVITRAALRNLFL